MTNQKTSPELPSVNNRRGFLRRIFTLGLGSAAVYAAAQPTAQAQNPTTMMVGEEGRPPTNLQPTTMAIGEEGQPRPRPQPRPPMTTQAIGEEGRPPRNCNATTLAVGEEGSPNQGRPGSNPTTLAVGEGGIPSMPYPNQFTRGRRVLTQPVVRPAPTKSWNSFRRW